MTTNNIITKRFVIRKTLINTNTIITFTTNKGKKVTYDHDKVYNAHKQRFEDMPCFAKYKSYTNTSSVILGLYNVTSFSEAFFLDKLS